MSPVATFVSFRLGGTDGVAIETQKWQQALDALGFETRRIAGELSGPARPCDTLIPGLAIEPKESEQRAVDGEPDLVAQLRDALLGSDVIVVENLLSIPLNLPAARALTSVLQNDRLFVQARIVLHHHDLAWQRPHLHHVKELPPDLPGALHVTINDISRHELADRGIAATTIRNCFDLDAPHGDRASTRAALGLHPDDLLVLQPTRAIQRKGIPTALALTEGLAAAALNPHFWLAGEPEEGYGPVLDELLAAARIPILRGRTEHMADAYAACDLVTFPSTWEGFGNPVIESIWAGKPLAVGHYPVLEELLSYGFQFLDANDPEAVAQWIAAPQPSVLERNLEIARQHFSLPALTTQLAELFNAAGWHT